MEMLVPKTNAAEAGLALRRSGWTLAERDCHSGLLQGRWHWPNAAACERRRGSLGGYRPSPALSQASCPHVLPEHLPVSPPLSFSLLCQRSSLGLLC